MSDELLEVCRRRVPRLQWDARRLTAIWEDFPTHDLLAVTGRALDWLAAHPDAKDGPRTVRTFLERAQPMPALAEQAHDLHFPCFSCGTQVSTQEERAAGRNYPYSTCRACDPRWPDWKEWTPDAEFPLRDHAEAPSSFER